MDIRYKLFPYPVLSDFSDDYISSGFISEVRAARDVNEVVFYINALIDNDELINLINEELAEFVFHIECSQTSYRSILCSKENENILRIPESKLSGKVTVCSFIVAKENINDFTNKWFNKDYEGMLFNIEKGNILAIGGQTDVNIIKELEELSKIPSIFSILRRDTNDNIGMEIEIEGEKIRLWLPNEEFYSYQLLVKHPDIQPSIHAMMVFPALIYTFEKLRNEGIEEYENLRWFKSIEWVLKKSDIILNKDTLELKTSYELAQKLLNLPINRALKALVNIEEDDEF